MTPQISVLLLVVACLLGFSSCNWGLSPHPYRLRGASNNNELATLTVDNTNPDSPRVAYQYVETDGSIVAQAVIGNTLYSWAVVNGSSPVCGGSQKLSSSDFQTLQGVLKILTNTDQMTYLGAVQTFDGTLNEIFTASVGSAQVTFSVDPNKGPVFIIVLLNPQYSFYIQMNTYLKLDSDQPNYSFTVPSKCLNQ